MKTISVKLVLLGALLLQPIASLYGDDAELVERLRVQYGERFAVFADAKEIIAPDGLLIYSKPDPNSEVLKRTTEKTSIPVKAEFRYEPVLDGRCSSPVSKSPEADVADPATVSQKENRKTGSAVTTFFVSEWSWQRAQQGHELNWFTYNKPGERIPKEELSKIDLARKTVIDQALSKAKYWYLGETTDIVLRDDTAEVTFRTTERVSNATFTHNWSYRDRYFGASFTAVPSERRLKFSIPASRGAPVNKGMTVIDGMSYALGVVGFDASDRLLFVRSSWWEPALFYRHRNGAVEIAIQDEKNFYFVAPNLTDLENFNNTFLLWISGVGTYLYSHTESYGDFETPELLGKRKVGIPFANYAKERFSAVNDGWKKVPPVGDKGHKEAAEWYAEGVLPQEQFIK